MSTINRSHIITLSWHLYPGNTLCWVLEIKVCSRFRRNAANVSDVLRIHCSCHWLVAQMHLALQNSMGSKSGSPNLILSSSSPCQALAITTSSIHRHYFIHKLIIKIQQETWIASMNSKYNSTLAMMNGSIGEYPPSTVPYIFVIRPAPSI